MATSRNFAYNTGSIITGATQYGNLAIGVTLSSYGDNPGGVKWWCGPDEDLGYVIAHTVPSGNQPNPKGLSCSVGFWRTTDLSDISFLTLVSQTVGQSFATASTAATWLNSNGYWTSYSSMSIVTSGLVLNLDAGDPLSYPGSGTTWTDTVGSKTFTLFNNPTYNSNNGGYLLFSPASSQYAQSTSLPSSLSTWTIEVWHYYTGTNNGSLPSIITELFPGVTSKINFNLGSVFTSPGGLESGFFDGSWRVTTSYSLTANNWYHIVGTYDGVTNKLYINNTLVRTSSFTGTPTSSQGGIRLMRRWDLPDYWGGRLSVVRIYTGDILATGVTQNWNAQKSRFEL
jgi:hypothetical protein